MRAEKQEEHTLAAGSAVEKPAADNLSYQTWASGVVRVELHKAGWRLADLLQKLLESNGVNVPSPAVAATPNSAAESIPAKPAPPVSDVSPKLVTITKPVTVRVPYGSVQIPAGMKLPYKTRNENTVRVSYMGADYDVPLTSTDLP